jgi:hypothetical protein
MPMWVELRQVDSKPIRGLPDPSGGTFDAAGDFDRFLENPELPVLGAIDPYADTTLDVATMSGLLSDIAAALVTAKAGPESRGLLRLQTLATRCQNDSRLVLVFIGD